MGSFACSRLSCFGVPVPGALWLLLDGLAGQAVGDSIDHGPGPVSTLGPEKPWLFLQQHGPVESHLHLESSSIHHTLSQS